jgi:hypothetical protein
MTKQMFPQFPEGPSSVPCADTVLNQIIGNYGGWEAILKPYTELPSALLKDLANADYEPDELVAWRLVNNSVGRERIVLMLAGLACNVASQDEPLAQQISEGYFHKFDDERKAHNVSFDEITVVAQKIRPYMQKILEQR